jgi:hypothetical protein
MVEKKEGQNVERSDHPENRWNAAKKVIRYFLQARLRWRRYSFDATFAEIPCLIL